MCGPFWPRPELILSESQSRGPPQPPQEAQEPSSQLNLTLVKNWPAGTRVPPGIPRLSHMFPITPPGSQRCYIMFKALSHCVFGGVRRAASSRLEGGSREHSQAPARPLSRRPHKQDQAILGNKIKYGYQFPQLLWTECLGLFR